MITVEGLGKRYRIRHQQAAKGYTALRDVIAQRIKAPFARADRTGEDFWALKDVSFEVQRGEVIGIIGRNGAGKSTLLKVLSRITEPTEGRVTLHGRVASLLEVGTGFHPELSGRENIFLNAAILGMTRAETVRKFDEIVAFAEVERFLDTPVKRYSSGMYVRLAFAVAAHLEPEILIVDEVLAVGDAEFQKKCLGKMHDVSRGGRTVLFVSHNMAAIKSLTTRCVVLRGGRITDVGSPDAAIASYLQTGRRDMAAPAQRQWGRGAHTIIQNVRLLDTDGVEIHHWQPARPLILEVILETDGASGLSLDAMLLDESGVKIGLASSHHFDGVMLPTLPGRYACRVALRPPWLASGRYAFDVTTSVVNSNWDHYVESAVEFDVLFSNPGERSWDFRQSFGYGASALLSDGGPIFTLMGVGSQGAASATR